MTKNNSNKPSGLVYISKNETENDKAPLFKGFINVTPELLEILNSAEPDSYGCVKLDVALWRDANKAGVLKGSATPPYKKNNEYKEQRRAPVASDNDGDF